MNPTPEQVAQWAREAQIAFCLCKYSNYETALATLACAWQAEQDAAICDNKHMTPSGPADCAAAIRANAPKGTT